MAEKRWDWVKQYQIPQMVEEYAQALMAEPGLYSRRPQYGKDCTAVPTGQQGQNPGNLLGSDFVPCAHYGVYRRYQAQ